MKDDKQELEAAIAQAISLIYSEEYEFDDIVIQLVMEGNVSALGAYVAIDAAACTKDGGSYDINQCMKMLAEATAEQDNELSLLRWQMLENIAKQDFFRIQMANMFMKIEAEGIEPSFGGAVYKAEKLKNGPLTREEREQLRLKYPPT